MIFALLTSTELVPIGVFVLIMGGTFWMLQLISQRNSVAEERLERLGRPKSLTDIDMTVQDSGQRFCQTILPVRTSIAVKKPGLVPPNVQTLPTYSVEPGLAGGLVAP